MFEIMITRRYSIFLISFIFLLSCFLFSACSQTETVYLYEVNEVEVSQPGVDKNSLKSDLEFISLAFSDLFGTTLTENQLLTLVTGYNAIGDKGLVADVIIRNFLNNPGADVPTTQEMKADVPAFIKATYRRFYVREPGEYELWYFENLIANDPDVTPEIIYYAFLTSDEYRYF
jgi:hypothetical protein